MRVVLAEERSVPSPHSRFQEYIRLRGHYLDLCRNYQLQPHDLSIPEIISQDFARHEDKVMLVKLILRICDLEKELKDILDDPLFPKTVCELERSGILLPARH
jgi:hypothetical protein